ncbi:MAG: hypothetical protein P4L50_09780 [Anaerolineaceae bacterium]|nr:hypothetical protein [Anaerolineaceae bacterium]
MVKRIEKNLARENGSTKNQFIIGLSIGCCTCTASGSLRDTINRADLNMYKNKSAKKRLQA